MGFSTVSLAHVIRKPRWTYVSAMRLPSCNVCSIMDKLSLSDSSCPSRYWTLCFLKHHFTLCATVIDRRLPFSSLFCTISTIFLISLKTTWLWLVISLAVSRALCEAIDCEPSRVMPTCFSIKENNEMLLAMLWISTSACASSTPTAFRIRDRRKPAPATPMTEAMMLFADIRTGLEYKNPQEATYPISAIFGWSQKIRKVKALMSSEVKDNRDLIDVRNQKILGTSKCHWVAMLLMNKVHGGASIKPFLLEPHPWRSLGFSGTKYGDAHGNTIQVSLRRPIASSCRAR